MAAPLLILGGVGLFVAGTIWGWVLHIAFTKPLRKEAQEDEQDGS